MATILSAVAGADPRLEKSRQEAIERVNRVNEFLLTVLKNHLVAEQFIDEFLIASGKRAKGSFADKAQHCQNLKPPEVDPPVWKMLSHANQLRNKIAHTLDEAEIKLKMDELRAAYLATLSPEQQKAAENLDDAKIAAGAFELFGAYLVAATKTAGAGGKP
jgi:hypothetical protein